MKFFKKIFDTSKSKDKKDEKVMDQIFNDIFPNGIDDISKGVKEVRFILKNRIDESTAASIFCKSAALIEIVKPEDRTKERLKISLEGQFPGLLSETECQNLFNFLTAFSISKIMKGHFPKRTENGEYYF